MKWVKDRSGRFPERPHYEPEELDETCEEIISDLLRRQHGRVHFPVATDDLTRLIEECAEDLDAYADLNDEGPGIEGVTHFSPGRRPRVRISKEISGRPEFENRLRTTLTHEFGHVRFHDFMFQMHTGDSLFSATSMDGSAKCNRASIMGASKQDWMEWQAGYVCGAILMPRRRIQETVRNYRSAGGHGSAVLDVGSSEGEALIREIVEQFTVSREAAKVRLLKLNLLAEAGHAGRGLYD
jgi:hypothetical protein